jgi:hypothetical protein
MKKLTNVQKILKGLKVRPKKRKLIWCVRLRLKTSTRSLQT